MCSGRFIWLRHGVWKDDAINPSSTCNTILACMSCCTHYSSSSSALFIGTFCIFLSNRCLKQHLFVAIRSLAGQACSDTEDFRVGPAGMRSASAELCSVPAGTRSASAELCSAPAGIRAASAELCSAPAGVQSAAELCSAPARVQSAAADLWCLERHADACEQWHHGL